MYFYKKPLILIFFLLFTVNLFSKDPYPKNPNIDILNYSFELHLNDTTDIIYGTANIKLSIKPNEDNVRFDLISKNKDKKGMSVENILFNGKEVPYTHVDNVINIDTKGMSYTISSHS